MGVQQPYSAFLFLFFRRAYLPEGCCSCDWRRMETFSSCCPARRHPSGLFCTQGLLGQGILCFITQGKEDGNLLLSSACCMRWAPLPLSQVHRAAWARWLGYPAPQVREWKFGRARGCPALAEPRREPRAHVPPHSTHPAAHPPVWSVRCDEAKFLGTPALGSRAALPPIICVA